MTSYWVVGGEYESTEFKVIADGGTPRRYGPYRTYEDALRQWSEVAWQSVDNCNIRFYIETGNDLSGTRAA
jgi:hypothetical protein